MSRSLCKKGVISPTQLMLLFIFAASLNIVDRYYFFLFIAVGIFFLNPKRKVYVDPIPMLMLLLLALSWIFFSPSSAISVLSPLKPITYLLCYIVGMSLMNDDRDYCENYTPYKLFYLTVFSIAFGTFVHYLLNWMVNLNTSDRMTIDFWTRSDFSATGQAALACIPLALAIALIFSRNRRFFKLTAVLVLGLVLAYNLILGGRTLILITLIVLLVAFLHQIKNEKRRRLKKIGLLVVLIVSIITLYGLDLFGIKSFVENSPLYERFFSENGIDIDEDGRMENKFYYLQNMWRFKWGGNNLRQESGYAHDIFLDTYDEAGIVALVSIVVYIAATLMHLIKCIKDKSVPFIVRQTVLCIYIALYLEFLVEPILQGMPNLFASFCLIDGYVCRITKQNRMAAKRK